MGALKSAQSTEFLHFNVYIFLILEVVSFERIGCIFSPIISLNIFSILIFYSTADNLISELLTCVCLLSFLLAFSCDC